MNRRGFLRAVVAAGLTLVARGPAEESADRVQRIVREAIHARRILRFRYHGHDRRVEPHALGRMKDGVLVLHAWQVAGGSRSEPPPGWRYFLLAGIDALGMEPATFRPRSDFRPDPAKLKDILATV